MKKDNTPELFAWKKTENGCPLDYPLNEVESKWERDIPSSHHPGKGFDRIKISKVIKHSDLFADAFPDQYFELGGHSHPFPIMIELEAFFRDFYLTYLQLDLSERQKITDSQTFPDHFGVDFFRNARDSIRGNPEVPIDELAYYEKELYKHPSFQRFAAEYYWEAEFDRRCRLLKKVVLECPPHLRLSGMPEILKFLDANIGAYAELARRSRYPKDESVKAFLSDLPANLCQLRDTDHVYYFFENIPIKTNETVQPLKSVFSQIRKISADQRAKIWEDDSNNDSQIHLLKAARKQYLSSLSQKVTECDFLTQAHKIDDYLFEPHLTSASEDIVEIALAHVWKEIQTIAIYRFFPLFYRLHNPLSIIPTQFPVNSTTAFLDGIIFSLSNTFSQQNQSEMQCLPIICESMLLQFLVFNASQQADCDLTKSEDNLYLLFQKYTGHDFPDNLKECTGASPIETLVAFYYNCLLHLECPNIENTSDSDSSNNIEGFRKRHPTYNSLLYCVRNDWNKMVQENRTQLEEYINVQDAPFPCSRTYLHSVLFFIKLYHEYHASIRIAAKCYYQYKQLEYREKGKTIVRTNKKEK